MKNGALSRIGSLFFRQLNHTRQSLNCLLWPKRCSACREVIDENEYVLCGNCWQELSFSLRTHYCMRCGRSVGEYGLLPDGCGRCCDEKLRIDGMLRVGLYESVLRKLILQLKFHEQTQLNGFLSGMLAEVWNTRSRDLGCNCLVPVPLHWRRRAERGFNQSTLLAKGLKTGLPVCEDLVRIRYTQRQWNLTPAQRRRNVRGAFAVRSDHSFKGKTIALVDDITTSGATLNECARVLKRAGAEKCYALVLAVAEQVD